MRCLIKAMIGLTIMLAASVICYAQSGPPPTYLLEPLTKLEALEVKTGTVIIKNYTVIGSVTSLGATITVTSYEFIDVPSSRKEYGIGVDFKVGDSLERGERLYVDYDEIDSLVKAIEYIIKLDRSETMENFEARYRTRGELSVATFNRATGALRASISSGITDQLRVSVSLGNLAGFLKILVDAKNTLDKIK